VVLGYLYRWQSLFAPAESASSRDRKAAKLDTGIYEQLLNDLVVPRLQQEFNMWPIRATTPLMQLLDWVKPVLTSSVFSMLLAQSIMPKLRREVDMWNPRSDAQPVQDWVCPWATLVSDDSMQAIYTVISFKLGCTLQVFSRVVACFSLFVHAQSWHPSDESALNVIQPWQTIVLELYI
jgi:tuftelin-interacting protein 11